jgi:hypothetical protein
VGIEEFKHLFFCLLLFLFGRFQVTKDARITEIWRDVPAVLAKSLITLPMHGQWVLSSG